MKSIGSGTLGRRSKNNMAGMRRQRSLEWRQERNYSSSDEELPNRPLDSHVFASLLAQAQQEFSSMDRTYRSDDTEDAATTDNPTSPFPTPPPTMISPRSPIPLHRQASPFPLENINARRIHYSTPQERLRGTSNGEVIYTSAKKPTTNSTIGRSGRSRHRLAGGMTSSSSATSCSSNIDNRRHSGGTNSEIYHDQQQRLNNLNINNDEDQESPPEPAPPEIPPRGPSLQHSTLRRRNEYMVPTTEPSAAPSEGQFLTTSNQGSEYTVSGGGNSISSSQYPARSPIAAVPANR